MKRKGAVSRTRKVGMVDLDSGELFENGVPVWVNAKVRWGEDWFMGFQQAFLEISEDRDMNHQMTRVWLNLLGRLGFENWISVPQVEIAESLQMKTSDVSRAIKRLVDKRLILKGPKIGRSNSFKLNSAYAWKGKVVNLKKERNASAQERNKAMEEAWAEIDEKKRKELIQEAQEKHFQSVQNKSSESDSSNP